MPSHVPREEPTRKREQLLYRAEDLRLAILHKKSEQRIEKLADRYRAAYISFIKAKIHFGAELEFQSRKHKLDINKLKEEILSWEQKSLKDIIIGFERKQEKNTANS
jgi:hypothetical protein